MSGYRIMIVEDDFSIQTQLKTLLSGNGYTVQAVTDFSKTVEQVKVFDYHDLLCDGKRKAIVQQNISSVSLTGTNQNVFRYETEIIPAYPVQCGKQEENPVQYDTP